MNHCWRVGGGGGISRLQGNRRGDRKKKKDKMKREMSSSNHKGEFCRLKERTGESGGVGKKEGAWGLKRGREKERERLKKKTD